MRKVSILVAVPALIAAILPAVEAQTSVDCGDVIKQSIRLAHHLVNCPDDGLVVGAGDIEIDLGGRTVDGKDGSDAGVRNDKGFKDVVVRNGRISGFDEGYLLDAGGTRNTVEDLEFTGNDLAVFIDGADDNVVQDNEVAGNDDGIAIIGDRNVVDNNEIFDEAPAVAIDGNRNEVSDNEVVYSTASDQDPAIVFDGNENHVTGNDVFAGGDGIAFIGEDNIVESNDLEGGSLDGVVMVGDLNRVAKNDIEHYAGRGIWLDEDDSTDNALFKNKVERSGEEGIFVEGNDSVVESNDLDHNGDDGLALEADNARIVDNQADDNRGFGIRAEGEGIEGSDNSADDNGEGQCTPSRICD